MPFGQRDSGCEIAITDVLPDGILEPVRLGDLSPCLGRHGQNRCQRGDFARGIAALPGARIGTAGNKLLKFKRHLQGRVVATCGALLLD